MGYVAQSLIIRLLDCPWMISHDNDSVLSTNCIMAGRFLIIFCKNFNAMIEIHIYKYRRKSAIKKSNIDNN